MGQKIVIAILGLASIFLGCDSSNNSAEEASKKYSDYVGRYALTSDLVFEVKEDSGLLTLLPSFWGSAQILDSIDTDAFQSLLHPRMHFTFKRDSTGQINSLTSTGNSQIEGTAYRLPQHEYKAVKFLLEGKFKEALTKLNDPNEKLSEDRIVGLAFNLIRFRRSKAQVAFDLVSEFSSKYPNSTDLYHIKGLASLLVEDREIALLAFQKAFQIDSTNSMTVSALRLLNAKNAPPIPENTWELPFNINDLFMEPTNDEIQHVRNDWNKRDLSIANYKLEKEGQMEFNGYPYRFQMISHDVHGEKHFGAVLIPPGAEPQNAPIILELRGVDSRYSPFKISKAKVPKILGDNPSKAIVVIPSFRGNTLIINDQEYTSEGSPKNAWDGAADDAHSFS